MRTKVITVTFGFWLAMLAISVYASFEEEWIARYDGPANDADVATAIVLDAQGNVYVTGWSVGIGTSRDYLTIKYDVAGEQQWEARYNGPGNNVDEAFAIALDLEANVYVTGNSWGDGTAFDFATIKYDAAGKQQWAARYNGPGNNFDEATAIAIDAEANVYVTGNSWGVGTLFDYATVKYDANGNQMWVARYEEPGEDISVAMAVDGEGNVYVTGGSVGAGTASDYATIKYDREGNQVWVARYNGPADDNDFARAIAIDWQGNVYVTGESWGVGTQYDYATIKYDRNGNQIWVARYDGVELGRPDRATAIALDADGNVYVTGWSDGVETGLDYATIKYDGKNGNTMWVARYNGPGNGEDRARAIAVDDEGSVYVTGNSWGVGTRDDYATVKYSAQGAQVSEVRYDGPASGDDVAGAIALDSEGNTYVTGGSFGIGTGSDYATVKYSQP